MTAILCIVASQTTWYPFVSEFDSTTALTNADVVGWSTSLPHSDTDLISNCDGASLFGGYNVFYRNTHLTKTYSDLRDHAEVKINVNLWAFDTWDHHSFFFNVDGV